MQTWGHENTTIYCAGTSLKKHDICHAMLKNIFDPQKVKVDDINDFCKNTMTDVLDIKITEIHPDYIKSEMPVNTKTIHPFRMMHGGASFVLAEHVGSVASNLVMDASSSFAFGQSLVGSHIKPANEGETVYGYAYALHLGATSHIWDIKIRNTNEQLVFSGQLTMAIRPKKTHA